MKVSGLEVLRCDAGWRNYYFLKLSTDDGVVGWSEFDDGFGSPGITAASKGCRRASSASRYSTTSASSPSSIA